MTLFSFGGNYSWKSVNVEIMSHSRFSYLNLLNKELSGFQKLLTTHYIALSQWVYSNVKPINGKESSILYLK